MQGLLLASLAAGIPKGLNSEHKYTRVLPIQAPVVSRPRELV